ncbi:MAG TPA: ATP synthase F1 subunit gamma [Candidatus Acidoferrales bacterium]|nr:ATP synthase F1 subunit gamma [Candidatus Acidoferrales bacterium]
MASLKVIRKRITSVKNTQKITKAMKMVSAAKLRRAQEAAEAARSYADKLTGLLQNVAARIEDRSHPLLQRRDEERSIHVLLVTADRGLCGGYNSNLIRKAEALLQERGRDRVRLTIVGRRGFDYFKRRGANIVDKHINIFGGPGVALAQSLAEQLAREFAEGETDGVYVLYSRFKSALTQVPTVEQLLPIAAQETEDSNPVDYKYEPDPATLLDRLLRQYVSVLVHRAFLEAAASEHGARMAAMDSATTNANDMIGRLTLQMNRARQAAITKELMEIVSGAEALKG